MPLTTRTPLAGLALASAGLLLLAGTAGAVSLGEMADEATTDLQDTVPALLAVVFYIIGAALFGFGLFRVKKHVDHPQQVTLGSALITCVIGAILIATPAAINAMTESIGLDQGTSTVTKPKL